MGPYLLDQVLELWNYFRSIYHPVWSTVDILAVAFGVYWLLLLIKGTRAGQMLAGVLVLTFATVVSQWAPLDTLGLILGNFVGPGIIIIVILFQHDIRRALARMGRPLFGSGSQGEGAHLLEEVVRAVQRLAQNRVGSLVVFEREFRLDDQLEAGVPIDASISKEILTAIFQPTSPLHDGAVILQDGRVAQARCVLPLTQRTLPEGLGTRHRAAVGISEETDAVVVVVSEETGKISVVSGGDLDLDLDVPDLRERLRQLLAGEAEASEESEPEPAAEPSASAS